MSGSLTAVVGKVERKAGQARRIRPNTSCALKTRQGLISTWYNRQILPGTNRTKEIEQQLEQASIILLLVSADFLASDYCNAASSY